jgi:hypothetical protein
MQFFHLTGLLRRGHATGFHRVPLFASF